MAAESRSGGDRIQLGAISQSCQNSADGSRAVLARLRQLGIEVEFPAMGSSQCVGVDCAAKLKGQPGFLLGGQVSRDQSHLWLVDLANDLVLVQRHVGKGSDKPDSLARQAAALAERAHDPQAGWTPRAQVQSCGESPGGNKEAATSANSKADLAAHGEPQVVLAVYAPQAVGKYAADFQKGIRRALLEMGISAREVRGVAPPGNPRDALPIGAKDLPLVDVQLLTSAQGKGSHTPDGAVVRVSDSHHASQTSIDCADVECEPQQLAQLVRRNTTAMLDRFVEAPSSLDPNVSPATVEVALCVPPPSCGAGLSGRQPAEGSPAQPPPSERPMPSSPAPTPDSTSLRGHWIGSGVLLGGGLLGLIPSGIPYSMNGQVDSSHPCTVGAATYPCHLNTATASGVTLALSGAVLAGGAIWLGVNFYKFRHRN